MISPIYVNIKIRFETDDDLRWFLKKSNWRMGGNLSEVGMELAVGYYLNTCREHKDEEDHEDYCCTMDSGCIYARIIKESSAKTIW